MSASASRPFWKDTLQALGEGEGRATLAAYLLSNVNAGLLVPVVPLFLVSKGFSLLQMGGTFSLVAALALVAQVAVARRPDPYARPGVVVPLLLLPAVLLPAYLYVQSAAVLLGLMAVSSLAGAVTGPALQMLLARGLAPGPAAAPYAHYGVVASFGYAGGVVLGGLLYGLSPVAVFYAGSLLAAVSALFALRRLVDRRALLPRPAPSDPARVALLGEVRDAREDARARGETFTRARRALNARRPLPPVPLANVRWMTLYTFLFGLAVAIYPIYLPMHLVSTGLPLAWVGVAIASSWVTYGAAQPFGARLADRTGRYREVLALSVLGVALFNLAMALTSAVWIALAWALLGVADGLGRPSVGALLSRESHHLGRGIFAWTGAAGTVARVVAPFGLALVLLGGGLAMGFLLVTVVLALAGLSVLLVRAAPPGDPA